MGKVIKYGVRLKPMGWTSELVAQAYKIPRKTQDEYALISHTRASTVRVPVERFYHVDIYFTESWQGHIHRRDHSGRNQRQGYQ